MSRSRGGRFDHVLVVDPDRAVVDVLEPGEHAQARRLAASGGTDEDEKLAVVHLEVEMVDCGAFALRKDPGRAWKEYGRHGSLLLLGRPGEHAGDEGALREEEDDQHGHDRDDHRHGEVGSMEDLDAAAGRIVGGIERRR